jgi:hypothetical protein
MWNIRKKGGALRLLFEKEDEIIIIKIIVNYSLLFYPNYEKFEKITFISFIPINRIF